MCKLTLGNKTVQSQVIVLSVCNIDHGNENEAQMTNVQFFQVVEDTVNPVWDEFYRFLVFNAKYQELNIEVIKIYFCYLLVIRMSSEVIQVCKVISESIWPLIGAKISCGLNKMRIVRLYGIAKNYT